MKKVIPIFSLILVAASCTQQSTNSSSNTFAPKVVEAKGYTVPKDRMALPKVILVDESKLKKIPVGKPLVVKTNTNIRIAVSTNLHLIGKPRICTPGQDTFRLPKTIFLSKKKGEGMEKSPVTANMPEIVIAKDPRISDNNPQSFSSFSKLQGLKQHIISCMLQDKRGNLWFGTYGGGVSKFDGKLFTHFTETEGLSNNTVRCILEDADGNIWLGTDDGVNKYDGYIFSHFNENKGLNNKRVRSVFQDKKGNIWIGTDGGISKYDGNSITHFTVKEGLSNNLVRSILQDNKENIWIGTDDGINKYDGKSFTHFTEKEGLSNNTVRSILQDKDGNIWFGTYGGVNKYDGTSFTYFAEIDGLSNEKVYSILQDKSGNIWFGTDGRGASKLEQRKIEGAIQYTFTHFTEKEGLSNNIIRSILQDRNGNIWFGTFNGVNKYDGKSFTHFTKKEGLSNNAIRSIVQDKNGNIWFGTDGGGISKYDGKSFTIFTEKDGGIRNIRSSLIDKEGNIWFGTYGFGVTKYDGKHFTYFTEQDGLSNKTVRCILQDKDGNIWFGTDGGGVSKLSMNKLKGSIQYSFTNFSKKQGLSNNIIFDIKQDKKGDMWFATDGGGVSKLSQTIDKESTKYSFTHFTEKEGLSNNTVRSILQDKISNIWFATDGGITKYDGKSFIHFTENEGLSDNTVYSILQDNKENIWFGTRSGLNTIRNSKLIEINDNKKLKSLKEDEVIFKKYNYEDGFFGIGCNAGALFEDKEGVIWVGANDRLTSFHPPFKTDGIDRVPPKIQLTSIGLFNENIPWSSLLNLAKNEGTMRQPKDTSFTLGNGVRVGNFKFDNISKWYGIPENLSLAYNNNFLTFNFIGITQNQAKKVKYKFKLEGIDKNWSALTDRTEAPYGNLPKGNYTFKVKAMNSEGFWSSEFKYSFVIRPPWWKTWIAYFSYWATGISILFVGSHLRTASLRREKIKLEKKVELRTNQLNIEKQETEKQKHIIEEKHQEITNSINYAKRIQKAFSPSQNFVDSVVNENFVLSIPKDIVSGDFYWVRGISPTKKLIITGDCTGHGVPGSILAIICSSLLGYIIVDEDIYNPKNIIEELNKRLIELLNYNETSQNNDGVDIAIFLVDTELKNIEFSGAFRPLIKIEVDGTLTMYNSDRQSLGGSIEDLEKEFTSQILPYNTGDTIYTFSDGYVDQFGGEFGKKLMSKKFKELLIEIQEMTMTEQKQYLSNFIQNWKGETPQTDDVLVIGVRL